jgi:hypothetical protein
MLYQHDNPLDTPQIETEVDSLGHLEGHLIAEGEGQTDKRSALEAFARGHDRVCRGSTTRLSHTFFPHVRDGKHDSPQIGLVPRFLNPRRSLASGTVWAG